MSQFSKLARPFTFLDSLRAKENMSFCPVLPVVTLVLDSLLDALRSDSSPTASSRYWLSLGFLAADAVMRLHRGVIY